MDNWILVQTEVVRLVSQNQESSEANYDSAARPDESPVRTVNLAPFQLGGYMVTVDEYRRFPDCEWRPPG
jgi:formylglycine-generating enzyme required for sulfatase activity